MKIRQISVKKIKKIKNFKKFFKKVFTKLILCGKLWEIIIGGGVSKIYF